MEHTYLKIRQSPHLNGTTELFGAKNATLVIMASTLLTRGMSTLRNIPNSSDIVNMVSILESFGARIVHDTVGNILSIDTSTITPQPISAKLMRTMRASVLVMGPLLAHKLPVQIGVPGGCSIGLRPINYHIDNLRKMGATITVEHDVLTARTKGLTGTTILLDYPSVGATENCMLAATLAKGTTRIVNAALEPEVLDLINILQKMGADITIQAPATVIIHGAEYLNPVDYTIMPDRLEAGSLLLAAAITGGSISLPQGPAYAMELFLGKLQEMGHTVIVGKNGIGIELTACKQPQAVSIKTGPYPSFPTDLQAPMMVALALAQGSSIIEETVFENRLSHAHELVKMGADIKVAGDKALVTGVPKLYGAHVQAADIRASCALAVAGLVAQGTTIMEGVDHWRRGYASLEEKLANLGAQITVESSESLPIVPSHKKQSVTHSD